MNKAAILQTAAETVQPTMWCWGCKMHIPYKAWKYLKDEDKYCCPICETLIG